MALDEPKENEKLVEVNGVSVLIAEDAMPFVDDSTVDYIKEDQNEGFIIAGPGQCC